MTPERYRRIVELFEAVLRVDASQRDDFLPRTFVEAFEILANAKETLTDMK